MIELPGGDEVVGVGDSLTMATDVEKYSLRSCVPVDIRNAFWQMENVGRFGKKDTQINQNK